MARGFNAGLRAGSEAFAPLAEAIIERGRRKAIEEALGPARKANDAQAYTSGVQSLVERGVLSPDQAPAYNQLDASRRVAGILEAQRRKAAAYAKAIQAGDVVTTAKMVQPIISFYNSSDPKHEIKFGGFHEGRPFVTVLDRDTGEPVRTMAITPEVYYRYSTPMTALEMSRQDPKLAYSIGVGSVTPAVPTTELPTTADIEQAKTSVQTSRLRRKYGEKLIQGKLRPKSPQLVFAELLKEVAKNDPTVLEDPVRMMRIRTNWYLANMPNFTKDLARSVEEGRKQKGKPSDSGLTDILSTILSPGKSPTLGEDMNIAP